MTKLLAMLAKHEGFRSFPYKDTVGKLTIGYGRNLDDVGISQAEALDLLSHDSMKAFNQASEFPWFEKLSEARQAVVISMIFNMGLNGFKGFTNTIAAIASGDYSKAASNMLVSKWASQVKGRAVELAEMMRTGEWS